MVNDMPAGREMDALVAEKVMGCKVSHLPFPGGQERVSCGCRNGEHPGPHDNTDPVWDDILAYYSTDIAAAWKVVEKLRGELSWADGFQLSQSALGQEWQNFPEAPQNGYAATFTNGYENEASATAETAPLTICRAALKAVE
jgi:hypothetical protein